MGNKNKGAVKISVIYQAINKINNKIYIGATNNFKRRKAEHAHHAYKDGGAFHEDIRKYGIGVFEWHILEECDDAERDERERYYITKYRETYGKDAIYNICDGGMGGQTHDVSGKNNPMYGHIYTEEEKRSRSEKLKGRAKPPGHGAKVSKALKGVPKSAQAVLKKSRPIEVINIETGEKRQYMSISAMETDIHSNVYTILNNEKKKTGFKFSRWIPKEDVETIESIIKNYKRVE